MGAMKLGGVAALVSAALAGLTGTRRGVSSGLLETPHDISVTVR